VFDFSSFDLSGWQWVLLGVCAVLVGITKTGIPGLGILVVPLMAIALGGERAKQSVGLLLPILIFADVFAIVVHRRNVRWRHIVRLMPWALAGIGTGALLMNRIDDTMLARLIGVIVLVMLGLRAWQNVKSRGQEIHVPQHWAFAAVMGFTAGVTTMMANAAGPVMILYLLSMQLPKAQFVGTRAWFFFFVNWTKVPLHVALGNITAASLALDLCLFAFVPVGALLGVVTLKRIPQKVFTVLIMILTAAAAVKLIL